MRNNLLYGLVLIALWNEIIVRFLRLYNYELKINNQSLAKICSLTCVPHLVPRAAQPAKHTGWRIGSENWKGEFCPEFEGVIFPMVWFAWHSLPGFFFFFLFLCKEREKWALLTKSRGRWGWLALLLLADERCDVVLLPICRAFLETWALFSGESSLSVYIYFRKRKWKCKRWDGIFKSRLLKRTRGPHGKAGA